jgi:hypothetical protein
MRTLLFLAHLSVGMARYKPINILTGAPGHVPGGLNDAGTKAKQNNYSV